MSVTLRHFNGGGIANTPCENRYCAGSRMATQGHRFCSASCKQIEESVRQNVTPCQIRWQLPSPSGWQQLVYPEPLGSSPRNTVGPPRTTNLMMQGGRAYVNPQVQASLEALVASSAPQPVHVHFHDHCGGSKDQQRTGYSLEQRVHAQEREAGGVQQRRGTGSPSEGSGRSHGQKARSDVTSWRAACTPRSGKGTGTGGSKDSVPKFELGGHGTVDSRPAYERPPERPKSPRLSEDPPLTPNVPFQSQESYSGNLGQASALSVMKENCLPLSHEERASATDMLEFIIDARKSRDLPDEPQLSAPPRAPYDHHLYCALIGGGVTEEQPAAKEMAMAWFGCGARSAGALSELHRQLGLPASEGRICWQLFLAEKAGGGRRYAMTDSHEARQKRALFVQIQATGSDDSRVAVVDDSNVALFQLLGGSHRVEANGAKAGLSLLHRTDATIVEEHKYGPIKREVQSGYTERVARQVESKTCTVCHQKGGNGMMMHKRLSDIEVALSGMAQAGMGLSPGGSSKNYMTLFWIQRFMKHLPMQATHWSCLDERPYERRFELEMPEQRIKELLCVTAFESMTMEELQRGITMVTEAGEPGWVGSSFELKIMLWALKALKANKDKVFGVEVPEVNDACASSPAQRRVDDAPSNPYLVSFADLRAAKASTHPSTPPSLTRAPSSGKTGDSDRESETEEEEVVKELKTQEISKSNSTSSLELVEADLPGPGVVITAAAGPAAELMRIPGGGPEESQQDSTATLPTGNDGSAMLHLARLWPDSEQELKFIIFTAFTMEMYSLVATLKRCDPMSAKMTGELVSTQLLRLQANQCAQVSPTQIESWGLVGENKKLLPLLPPSLSDRLHDTGREENFAYGPYQDPGPKEKACNFDGRIKVLRQLVERYETAMDSAASTIAEKLLHHVLVAESGETAHINMVATEEAEAYAVTGTGPAISVRLTGGGPTEKEERMIGDFLPQQLSDGTMARLWVSAGRAEVRLVCNTAYWLLLTMRDPLVCTIMMPGLARMQEGQVMQVTYVALFEMYRQFGALWEARGCLCTEVTTLAAVLLQFIHRIHLVAGLPNLWWLRWAMEQNHNLYEPIFSALRMCDGQERDLTQSWPDMPIGPRLDEASVRMFEIAARWFRSPASSLRTAGSVCSADEAMVGFDADRICALEGEANGVQPVVLARTEMCHPAGQQDAEPLRDSIDSDGEGRTASETLAFLMKNGTFQYFVHAARETGMLTEWVLPGGIHHPYVMSVLSRHEEADRQSDAEIEAAGPYTGLRGRILRRLASDLSAGRTTMAILAKIADDPSTEGTYEFARRVLKWDLSETADRERSYFWETVDAYELPENAACAAAGLPPVVTMARHREPYEENWGDMLGTLQSDRVREQQASLGAAVTAKEHAHAEAQVHSQPPIEQADENEEKGRWWNYDTKWVEREGVPGKPCPNGKGRYPLWTAQICQALGLKMSVDMPAGDVSVGNKCPACAGRGIKEKNWFYRAKDSEFVAQGSRERETDKRGCAWAHRHTLCTFMWMKVHKHVRINPQDMYLFDRLPAGQDPSTTLISKPQVDRQEQSTTPDVNTLRSFQSTMENKEKKPPPSPRKGLSVRTGLEALLHEQTQRKAACASNSRWGSELKMNSGFDKKDLKFIERPTPSMKQAVAATATRRPGVHKRSLLTAGDLEGVPDTEREKQEYSPTLPEGRSKRGDKTMWKNDYHRVRKEQKGKPKLPPEHTPAPVLKATVGGKIGPRTRMAQVTISREECRPAKRVLRVNHENEKKVDELWTLKEPPPILKPVRQRQGNSEKGLKRHLNEHVGLKSGTGESMRSAGSSSRTRPSELIRSEGEKEKVQTLSDKMGQSARENRLQPRGGKNTKVSLVTPMEDLNRVCTFARSNAPARAPIPECGCNKCKNTHVQTPQQKLMNMHRLIGIQLDDRKIETVKKTKVYLGVHNLHKTIQSQTNGTETAPTVSHFSTPPQEGGVASTDETKPNGTETAPTVSHFSTPPQEGGAASTHTVEPGSGVGTLVDVSPEKGRTREIGLVVCGNEGCEQRAKLGEAIQHRFCSMQCWREDARREHQKERQDRDEAELEPEMQRALDYEERNCKQRAIKDVSRITQRTSIRPRGGGPETKMWNKETTLTNFSRPSPQYKHEGDWRTIGEILEKQEPVMTIKDGRWIKTEIITALKLGLAWTTWEEELEGKEANLPGPGSRHLRSTRELVMQSCPVGRFGKIARREWEIQILPGNKPLTATRLLGGYMRRSRTALRVRGGGDSEEENSDKERELSLAPSPPPAQEIAEVDIEEMLGPAARLTRSRSKPQAYSDDIENERSRQLKAARDLQGQVRRRGSRNTPHPRKSAISQAQNDSREASECEDVAVAPPLVSTAPPEPERIIRSSKVVFYDPATWLVYCWKRTCKEGNLDCPGGHQITTDLSNGHALIRECGEEINLPDVLQHRLFRYVHSGRAPRECYCKRPDRPRETQHLSVWFVPALPLELRAIVQTTEGAREGHSPGVYPIADLIATSMYAEALHEGRFNEPAVPRGWMSEEGGSTSSPLAGRVSAPVNTSERRYGLRSANNQLRNLGEDECSEFVVPAIEDGNPDVETGSVRRRGKMIIENTETRAGSSTSVPPETETNDLKEEKFKPIPCEAIRSAVVVPQGQPVDADFRRRKGMGEDRGALSDGDVGERKSTEYRKENEQVNRLREQLHEERMAQRKTLRKLTASRLQEAGREKEYKHLTEKMRALEGQRQLRPARSKVDYLEVDSDAEMSDCFTTSSPYETASSVETATRCRPVPVATRKKEMSMLSSSEDFNQRYRKSKNSHTSKVAFYDAESRQCFCWLKRIGSTLLGRGNLDLPGGPKENTDNTEVAAAVRACREDIELPSSIQLRMMPGVCRATRFTCIDKERSEDDGVHSFTLWMIPATLDELRKIRQTSEGAYKGMQPGVYSLLDLAQTAPYGAAIADGLESIREAEESAETNKGRSPVSSRPESVRSSGSANQPEPEHRGGDGGDEDNKKRTVGLIIASFNPVDGLHHVLTWGSMSVRPLNLEEAGLETFDETLRSNRCGFMLTRVDADLSDEDQLTAATLHLHAAVGTRAASCLLNPNGQTQVIVPRLPPSYWLYPGTDQPIKLDFSTANGTRYFVIVTKSVPKAWLAAKWIQRNPLQGSERERVLVGEPVDILRKPFPPSENGRWLASDHAAYSELARSLADGYLLAGEHAKQPDKPTVGPEWAPETPEIGRGPGVPDAGPNATESNLAAVVEDLKEQLTMLKDTHATVNSTPESLRTLGDCRRSVEDQKPINTDDSYPAPTEEQLTYYRKSHHWLDLQVIMTRKFSPTVMDARRHRYFLPRVVEKERTGGYAEKSINTFMASRVLLPPKRLGVSTDNTTSITTSERTASWKSYLLLLVPLLREAYEGGMPVISFLVRLRSNILADLAQKGLEHVASNHNFVSIINNLELDRSLWSCMKSGAQGQVLGETSLMLDLFLELLSKNYMGPADENEALRRFEAYERPGVGSVTEAMRTLVDFYLAAKNPATNPDNITREQMFASKEHCTAILNHFMVVVERDRTRPWGRALRNHVRMEIDNILCELQANTKTLADLAPTPHNMMLQRFCNHEAFLSSEWERTNNGRTTGKGLSNPRNGQVQKYQEDKEAEPETAQRTSTEARLEARISRAEAGQADNATGAPLPRSQIRELRKQRSLLLKIKGGNLPQREVQELVEQLRESRQSMISAPQARRPVQRVNALVYDGHHGYQDEEEEVYEDRRDPYQMVAYVGAPSANRAREERFSASAPPAWKGGGQSDATTNSWRGGKPQERDFQGNRDAGRNPRPFNRDGAPPPPPQQNGNYQLRAPFENRATRQTDDRNGNRRQADGQDFNPPRFNDSVWGGQRPSLLNEVWNSDEMKAFKGNTINFTIIDELLGTDAGPECSRLRPLHKYDERSKPQQATGPQNPPPQLDPNTGKRIWSADACQYCTNTPLPPQQCTMPPTHLYVYGNGQRNHASSRCYACKLAILYSKDLRIRKAFCPPLLQKYTGPPGSM